MPVPALRIKTLNAAPIRTDGDFVVYWMIAARRPFHNFGLERAVEVATEMDPARMIFADWAPAGAQTVRWDQDLNRLVVLN